MCANLSNANPLIDCFHLYIECAVIPDKRKGQSQMLMTITSHLKLKNHRNCLNMPKAIEALPTQTHSNSLETMVIKSVRKHSYQNTF